MIESDGAASRQVEKFWLAAQDVALAVRRRNGLNSSAPELTRHASKQKIQMRGRAHTTKKS